MKSRQQELTDRVFAIEGMRTIFDYAKRITLHQTQIAEGLTDGELFMLGALIKVAGFHDIEITITGKCGDANYGEKPKE
jgi:hypothetical protein